MRDTINEITQNVRVDKFKYWFDNIMNGGISELSWKQNLTKMECYFNGVKQTEIVFTWEEIPWP